ncbi:MAG: SDR family oxidoreductase, partial [Spirochaetaceae bacterium]|nr:SDR family oxidoreductase [Spirochaetaceae bacterium]
MKRFKDKVVAVTGGASGIGKAVAGMFRDEGALVVVLDKQTIVTGDGIFFHQLDVRQGREVSAAAETIERKFGKLDVLCNVAGVELNRSLFDTSEDEWDLVMDVNVKGMFLLCKSLLPLIIKSGGGAVVNVSSISGLLGWPDSSAYCASKGAVILLTKQLSLEFGKYNIRVNAVAPGTTKTPMIDRLLKDEADIQSSIRLIQERHPLGRFAEPEEIA